MLPGEVHVFTSGSTGVPVRHVKDWTGAGRRRAAGRRAVRAGRARPEALADRRHHAAPAHVRAGGDDLRRARARALHFGRCRLLPRRSRRGGRAGGAGRLRRDRAGHQPAASALSRGAHPGFAADPLRRLGDGAAAPRAGRRPRGGRGPGLRDLRLHRDGVAGLAAHGDGRALDAARGLSADPGREGWEATAPHLGGAVPLPDEIVPEADGRFRLLGRRGEMVRIAGKRQSLGALNAALSTLSSVPMRS